MFPLLIFFLAMTLTPTYRYTDGNNNHYSLHATGVRYTPVTQMQSSSGRFDGGQPWELAPLPEHSWNRLEELIQRALRDTMQHIQRREMGCGTLQSPQGIVFIRMNAPTKQALEAYLHELGQQALPCRFVHPLRLPEGSKRYPPTAEASLRYVLVQTCPPQDETDVPQRQVIWVDWQGQSISRAIVSIERVFDRMEEARAFAAQQGIPCIGF
ncbi:MAG: hypothetical protein ACFCUI_03145 [Bernardetiaceae bacterium]